MRLYEASVVLFVGCHHTHLDGSAQANMHKNFLLRMHLGSGATSPINIHGDFRHLQTMV